MRKNIGIDFDGTFTDNPLAWSAAIRALQFKYRIYCVSARTDNVENAKELFHSLPIGITFYLTSHRPKKKFMEELGIKIDIWIDNEPMSLYVDDRTLQSADSE